MANSENPHVSKSLSFNPPPLYFYNHFQIDATRLFFHKWRLEINNLASVELNYIKVYQKSQSNLMLNHTQKILQLCLRGSQSLWQEVISLNLNHPISSSIYILFNKCNHFIVVIVIIIIAIMEPRNKWDPCAWNTWDIKFPIFLSEYWIGQDVYGKYFVNLAYFNAPI